MLSVVLIFIGFAIILSMTTAGAVLFLKIWGAKLPRPTRILLAAFAGSFIPLISMMSFAILESGLGASMLVAIIVGGALPILFIGWPVALFATRRLDRLMETPASVFE